MNHQNQSIYPKHITTASFTFVKTAIEAYELPKLIPTTGGSVETTEASATPLGTAFEVIARDIEEEGGWYRKSKKRKNSLHVCFTNTITCVYRKLSSCLKSTMTTCSHLGQLTRLSQPKLSQSVHREECTQCFDDQVRPFLCSSKKRLTDGIDRGCSQDTHLGVEVCLSCFNGGCLDPERHHARTHVYKSGHTFSLNVKRKPKPSTKRVLALYNPFLDIFLIVFIGRRRGTACEDEKTCHYRRT